MSNQEIIRREQYCQIVSEITGSDEYMVVGMDVGKDKHHAFVGTATGICIFKKLIFDNNLEGCPCPSPENQEEPCFVCAEGKFKPIYFTLSVNPDVA